ncbi:MAG: pdxA [Gammaproteobacteria bacterium]|jgi:4-hydroxythreonine-4-phosphate dehydrogenase|nr:pdxA [Gammaproteobacteria bacterium]
MPNPKKVLPVIAFSVGEPAGIGPDIAVKLAQYSLPCSLIVIANSELLLSRAKQLGLSLKIKPYSNPAEPHQKGSLLVYNLALGAPVIPSELNKANAEYVLKGISTAANMCMDGRADAMVTGPVHKGIINESGVKFSGHTEWIAALCHDAGVRANKRSPLPEFERQPELNPGEAAKGENCTISPFANPHCDKLLQNADHGEPLMLLASKKLKVALATTHIPLSEVPKNITKERLSTVLHILDRSLKNEFGIRHPHIAVCGLNPHAGENGHIGTEEQAVMIPCLDELKAQGLKLSGPLPADTVFAPQRSQEFDAILALYHDQGLAPLKARFFGEIVNITLGLPIIRTSVDHGTALDVAGTLAADERSLLLAISYAVKLVQQKR